MKAKPLSLSSGYLAALRKHLNQGDAPGLMTARRLGIRAVTLGLETLDIARIHEESLTTLGSSLDPGYRSNGMVRRGRKFFAEAITPLEETHRGAREASVHLKVMIESLTRRTSELAISNEELKQEIVHRRKTEASLRASERTTCQLLEKSRQMQEELRLLSRRLLSVQEEERKRISRELHDVIAQTLTGINLRLATMKSKSIASAKDFHERIAVTQRLVEKSVDMVHRFARDLRPAVLDDLGLIPAIDSFLKDFREETGIGVNFTAFPGVEDLDNARRTVLYRVVQEALNNVARHAKASRAKVTIVKRRAAICLAVHDNGKGFRVGGAVFGKNSKRLGLLGMRERVEMVDGNFSVESAPGKETTIRVEIPHRMASAGKRAKQAGNLTFKNR